MMKEDFSEDIARCYHHDDCVQPSEPAKKKATTYDGAIDAAKAILAMTKENLNRDGLQKTPERFAKAYSYLLSGYDKTPQDAVGEGVFAKEGTGLVSVDHVEFFSMCEHHLLPFWGTAKVLYFPNEHILGLSKIPRLVDLYSRRVQVQERITEQLVDGVCELIKPRAVAVRLEAQHMCMMMRGVEKLGSSTKTEKIFGFNNLETWEKQQLMNALNS